MPETDRERAQAIIDRACMYPNDACDMTQPVAPSAMEDGSRCETCWQTAAVASAIHAARAEAQAEVVRLRQALERIAGSNPMPTAFAITGSLKNAVRVARAALAPTPEPRDG